MLITQLSPLFTIIFFVDKIVNKCLSTYQHDYNNKLKNNEKIN